MGTSEIENKLDLCDRHSVELRESFPGWKGWCPECCKEDEERLKREEQLQRLERQANRLKSLAKLPERFAGCTFENYEATLRMQQTALTQCHEYVKALSAGGDNSLILSGTVGTGKTHLGCAIANQIIDKIIDRQRFDLGDVRYVTVPDLIREVRATWGDYGPQEDEVFDKYGYCYLLVLDEVGVQRNSEDEHRILFNVVNRRYEYRLPTVIITNLAVSNLDRALGERVVDRLRENGKAVTFDWASHRRHVGSSSGA